jgi:hypothetical protein
MRAGLSEKVIDERKMRHDEVEHGDGLTSASEESDGLEAVDVFGL